ncbi:MAG: hypothetical protein AVO39_07475 [delta proteobacterium MLS_D]|nr:MAG: hypothetical protein AVO39_07475 [delta proteobacterium MLS_D]
MSKIAIATLGCKVNHYESAGIIEALRRSNHDIVDFRESADIYIVNTCTVTSKTDYQSRQLVRRAHRRNPEAPIVVTGCYAQIDPERLAVLDGVTLVAGDEAKELIPRFIERDEHRSGRIIVGNTNHRRPFSSLPVTVMEDQTRAYLKIQDGCDTFCSYCIIPYARGRSRSLPADDVVEAVQGLIGSGYREIVLTGIHLGHYGRDLPQSPGLASLLSRIEADTSLERIRVSSLEPMDITNDLLETIGSSRRLCRHLHLALQSGDDGILRLMGRDYSTAHFRELVYRILDHTPETAIGVDIMVGFPGEGQREFENTAIFVESLPLAYFHVFPYSSRPGTRAAVMENQIDEHIKRERARILRELGAEKRTAFLNRSLGSDLSVLVERKRDRATGLFRGFSDTYIPVCLKNGDSSLLNRIVTVNAESIKANKILGKVKANG